MIFEWNEAKRAANLAQHRVDFKAARSFDWTRATQAPDLRVDADEHRWRARGLIGGRVHLLTFSRHGDEITIISLRRANPAEKKTHEADARA
jgi:uncharacterized DUF497 family protein